jgi:alpha-galactosidase
MMTKRSCYGLLLACFLFLCGSMHAQGGPGAPATRVVNEGGKIMVEFDGTMQSRVIAQLNGRVPLGDFRSSEFVTVDGKEVDAFAMGDFRVGDWKDSLGTGKEYQISGTANNLQKKISIVAYKDFPTMLFYKVEYQNTGSTDITLDGWTNNNYSVSAAPVANGKPALWSYQPGSYGWDNDWIIPLDSNYTRDNYLGMNAVDYGGGTPVADLWRPECGVAVGHVELVPKLVSFPVTMVHGKEGTLSITYKKKIQLKPGAKVATFRTFVGVHTGDHFNTLVEYSRFMQRQGFTFKKAPDGAYGNEWCGWGFEETWTTDQLLAALPKAKEIGLTWFVLDMGWYTRLGDFAIDKKRFPNGEADIKKFVQKVHSYGMKIQLWWMPMAVAFKTDLLAQHPEYLIYTEDGSPRFMPSFFKAFFLCPASTDVVEFSRQQVARLMSWGVDGLKIDGNNLNGVPACFNPEHKHPYPEASVEALPGFFKMVYETALSVNPEAKIEICPCGTNQSFYLMPYMNETVASDPHTSWHVRIKGKTLKAMTGSNSVFYGDHVELSDNHSDFAATIGVGGAIGTKFVYPPGVHLNTESGDVSLTPEREQEWRKWITISNENPLARGEYRGELYDIGFDRPETHAVQLNGSMYYALYAPTYEGEVEFRGLNAKKYDVVDYEHHVTLGTIKGPVGKLKVSFKNHLLVKTSLR